MSDEEKGASVVGVMVIERVNVEPHYVDPGGKARRDGCRVSFHVGGLSPGGPVEFIGNSIIPGDVAGALNGALEMFLSYLRGREHLRERARDRAIG